MAQPCVNVTPAISFKGIPMSPESFVKDGAPPPMHLPDVRVPAGWTLGGLALGLGIGIALSAGEGAPDVVAAAQWLGGLWLRGLQMTIVPLVVALLVMGIVRTIAAAQAGRMAAWTLAQFAAILVAGTTMAALVMPRLLDAFPIPAQAEIGRAHV